MKREKLSIGGPICLCNKIIYNDVVIKGRKATPYKYDNSEITDDIYCIIKDEKISEKDIMENPYIGFYKGCDIKLYINIDIISKDILEKIEDVLKRDIYKIKELEVIRIKE